MAAGYVVYGPSTELVFSLGSGVQAFTLDHAGRWLMTVERMNIPAAAKEYAINASNSRHWQPPVQRYVSELLAGKTGPRAKDFNMRWVGSMVADVHRILCRGGVFMYPADLREPDKPGRSPGFLPRMLHFSFPVENWKSILLQRNCPTD